jgi:anti-sigma factor RsiW
VIPLRCLIVQGHLGRFVDGALPAARSRTVRDHVAVCARCLEAERMARAIPVMLSSSLDPPPPPTLLPRLLRGNPRQGSRDRRVAAVAAALVLLLACAALAGTRSRAQSRPAPAAPGRTVARALVVSHDPPGSVAAGRPAAATLGAAPAGARTLPPTLKVGQFTVPNLASPCPPTERGRTVSGHTDSCQTQATPMRSNRP